MKKRYRNIVIIGIFILSLISIGFSEEELTCVHYQDSSSMNGFKPDFRHKLNSGNNASAIALIPPSQANVYTLNIYVSFPDHPEHHELPSFCTSIESSVQNYFEEMSYGSHHVHLTTAHRPSPNVSKCYIADNPAWFYNCCFC